MKKTKISLLGCGWLGESLAAYLDRQGYDINVSTASSDKYEELKMKWGSKAFQIAVQETKVEGDITNFLSADILIINITPNRKEKDQFASFFPLLKQSSIAKVLFVSSISVYPLLNRRIAEDEGAENQEHPLYLSEQLFEQAPDFETTIVRMAGLIGGKRHPGRFFAKSGRIKDSEAPVNLIHRYDCIQIISEIIQQEAWGEVFNACASTHPSKAEFYTKAATSIGLDAPICEKNVKPPFKHIDNQKVKAQLGIHFKHDNLMELLEKGKWE